MIRISILYPTSGGSRFDHDYYRLRHLPLIKERLGDACRHYAIDSGLAGDLAGGAPIYVASCHIFCDSLEAFRSAIEPHAAELTEDVANYTDIAPLMQISEVVEGVIPLL